MTNQREKFEITKSIIHKCPAIKLPQSYLQKLGNTAQIIVLKGCDDDTANFIANACNAALSAAPASQNDWNAAIEAMDRAKKLPVWDRINHALHVELDTIFKALSKRPVAQQAVQDKDAVADVIAERQRQMAVEGWTPEHDDEHSDRSLAQAAGCYVNHYFGRQWVYAEGDIEAYQEEGAPFEWPDSWCVTWFKPKNPRRDLVRAAALLIAEIERLDRAAIEWIKKP